MYFAGKAFFLCFNVWVMFHHVCICIWHIFLIHPSDDVLIILKHASLNVWVHLSFKLSLFSYPTGLGVEPRIMWYLYFDYLRGTIILFSIMPVSNLYSWGVPIPQQTSLHLFFCSLLDDGHCDLWWNLYHDIYFGNRILPPSLRLPPVLSQTKMPPNISSMLTSICFYFLNFRKWNNRLCLFWLSHLFHSTFVVNFPICCNSSLLIGIVGSFLQCE